MKSNEITVNIRYIILDTQVITFSIKLKKWSEACQLVQAINLSCAALYTNGMAHSPHEH